MAFLDRGELGSITSRCSGMSPHSQGGKAGLERAAEMEPRVEFDKTSEIKTALSLGILSCFSDCAKTPSPLLQCYRS